MSESLTYPGRVEKGQIKLPGAKMRTEITALFEGRDIEVIVRRKKKHRSSPQNRFYWAVVVPMVRAGLKEIGEILSLEQVHELLKFRHIREQRIDENTGEVAFEYTRSTAELTTVEFAEYIERCAQFAAEYLRVTIPDPM